MENKIDGLRLRIRNYVLEGLVFARKIPYDKISRSIIDQFVRAITSIGANFQEATEASTDRDVVYKLSISKKEAGEVKYWLDLIINLYPILNKDGLALITKTDETIRIIASIMKAKSNH